jgi:hypothetical protein
MDRLSVETVARDGSCLSVAFDTIQNVCCVLSRIYVSSSGVACPFRLGVIWEGVALCNPRDKIYPLM